MKNSIYTVLLVALAMVLFVSCESADKGKGKLDPNAMISLRPAAGVPSGKAENPAHLSALEIVKTTATIKWYHKPTSPKPLSRTFAEEHKDLITPKLLMWGTDIITQMGEYTPIFIEGEDIVINQYGTKDTIAYIPNSVIKAAQPLIKAAYDAQDYETCYALFDKAFTFIPITGQEWRDLRDKGLN